MDKATHKQPQISAHVSIGTKMKLDRLSRARGLRKAFVLEQALRYYLRTLENIPDEAFIPPRLVLSPEAFDQVLDMIENPPDPSQAILELMYDDRDSSSEEE